jgi:TetR/AcrR family transcriptional regulator, mexCD-oprJ operon repressor
MSENAKNTRADAQRNRGAILEAAIACLATDPEASATDIAKAAGVGRVTLYGHFSSRDDLLHAVAAQVMHEVESDLGSIPLDGDPMTTLVLISQSSWRLIDRFQGVVSAMERGREGGSSRQDHDHVLGAVRRVIERGQAIGAIRHDQSPAWLASCLYSILHNAGAETRAGRLRDDEVSASLPATVRALMSVPHDEG